MIFLMYSKDNCPWCEKAKDFILSPQRQTKNELHIINVSSLDSNILDKIKSNLSEYIAATEKLTVPQIFRVNSLSVPKESINKETFPWNLFSTQVGTEGKIDHYWTISHIGGYAELEKYMEGR